MADVIRGPWDNVKIPESTTNTDELKHEENVRTLHDIAENVIKIDELTRGIMVQLIHTCSEVVYDIASDDFIQDMAFLSESLRSALYRQNNLKHPLSILNDHLFTDQGHVADEDNQRTLRVEVINDFIEFLQMEDNDKK